MSNVVPPPPPGGAQLPPPAPPRGGASLPPPSVPRAPTGYDDRWASGAGTHPQGYASWGSRVGATLLRGVALLPAYVPALIGSAIGDVATVTLGLVSAVFMLAATIRMYIQRGHLGTDLGDAALGQQLVRASTGAPMGSGWSIFGRGLLHVVDAIPFYLGYLFPLWDTKRQTFTDKILKTVVVTRVAAHPPGVLYRNAFELWKPVITS